LTDGTSVAELSGGAQVLSIGNQGVPVSAYQVFDLLGPIGGVIPDLQGIPLRPGHLNLEETTVVGVGSRWWPGEPTDAQILARASG
jgi:hypothetical protein